MGEIHHTREARPAPPVAASQQVLVIDGASDAHAQSVRPVLDAGYRCQVVGDVEGALDSLARAHPGLVLCDPATAGGATGCARLGERLRRAQVPLVLLLEENAPVALIEAGHQAGAADCIVRPVRLQHITSRLTALASTVEGPPGARPGGGRVVLVGRERAFVARLGAALEHCGYRVLCVRPDQALSVVPQVPEGAESLVLLCQEGASRFDDLGAAFARRKGKPPTMLRVADAVETTGEALAWVSADVFGVEMIVDLANAHFHRHSAGADRTHRRTPFFSPVELRELDSPDAPWSSGYTNDLSPGGLCVRTLVPPRVRSCVELRIHLPSTPEPIEAKCVVVWSNPYAGRGAWSWQVGAGLQFLGMAPRQLTERCAVPPS